MMTIKSMFVRIVCITSFGLSAQISLADRDALPIRKVTKFNYTQHTQGFIVALEYNPVQTEFFYSATADGEIIKWNDLQANAVWKIIAPVGEDGFLEAIKVSRDGKLLFGIGSDEKIMLFNADDGSALPVNYQVGQRRPLPIKSHFTALAIDAGNNFFAAGDANGYIYVWSFSETNPRMVFATNGQPVKELTFDSAGEVLTSVSSSEILLWNIEQQSLIVRVNDILGFDNFWIESIYAPAYEPYLVITTFTDTVLFDLQSRRIIKKYPISTGDDGEKGQILKSIVDKSFEHVWQFYKEPLVEKLDIESGDPVQGYIDPSIFATGGFRIGAYTHVALKPGANDKFVAAVFAWDINIFTGELKVSILLRHYQM